MMTEYRRDVYACPYRGCLYEGEVVVHCGRVGRLCERCKEDAADRRHRELIGALYDLTAVIMRVRTS